MPRSKTDLPKNAAGHFAFQIGFCLVIHKDSSTIYIGAAHTYFLVAGNSCASQICRSHEKHQGHRISASHRSVPPTETEGAEGLRLKGPPAIGPPRTGRARQLYGILTLFCLVFLGSETRPAQGHS